MEWLSDLFKKRTNDEPQQDWMENNKYNREKVYREGKERIIEDTTGAKPKQGFFKDLIFLKPV